MDGCVLLTSTPSCVVSPRGETTYSGVDVNNTHPSMINPLNNIVDHSDVVGAAPVGAAPTTSSFSTYTWLQDETRSI